MSSRQALDQKKQSFWKKLHPLLKQHPKGITIEEIMKIISDKQYTLQFVTEFVNEMRTLHCIIGVIDDNTLLLRLRPKSIVSILKTLHSDYMTVYNCIEATNCRGVWSRQIAQSTQFAPKQVQKILKKLLSDKLIHEFTNPKTRRKCYMCAGFSPSDDIKPTPFHKNNGRIDADFVDEMKLFITQQINNAGPFGMTSTAIAAEIQKQHKTTLLEGLPLEDVERIIQLLLFDYKIEIIPQSIPRDIIESFCNSAQNTCYHILRGINEIRKYKNYIQRTVDEKLSVDKIKTERKQIAKAANNASDLSNLSGLNRKRSLMRMESSDHSATLASASSTADNTDSLPIKPDPFAVGLKRRKLNPSSEETKNDDTKLRKVEIKYDTTTTTDAPKQKPEIDIYDLAITNGIMLDENKEYLLKMRGENEIRFRRVGYTAESSYNCVPCQSCPVSLRCSDDGVINPYDCIYLKAWLDL